MEQPIDELRRRVAEKGPTKVGAELGVTRQMIAYLLRGERGFSDHMADQLGFEKIVIYRKVKK